MRVEISSINALKHELEMLVADEERKVFTNTVRYVRAMAPLQKEQISFEVGLIVTFIEMVDGIQVLYEMIVNYGKTAANNTPQFQEKTQPHHVMEGELKALAKHVRSLGLRMEPGKIELY